MKTYTMISRTGYVVRQSTPVRFYADDDTVLVAGTLHRRDEVQVREDGTIVMLASGTELHPN